MRRMNVRSGRIKPRILGLELSHFVASLGQCVLCEEIRSVAELCLRGERAYTTIGIL